MASKVGAKPLSEALNNARSVRLYGVPLEGLGNLDTMISTADGKGVELAQIRAFAFGAYCKELPVPVLLLLPAVSTGVDEGDKCGIPGVENVWKVQTSAEIGALGVDRGAALDVIERVQRGIDGGLTIDRVWIDNGRLCVALHVWASISVFGHSVGFDERPTVCIPLEGCHTVWTIEIARLDLCVNSNWELCAKLCVGKWGLERCWDACTPIPHAASTSSAGKTCDCAA